MLKEHEKDSKSRVKINYNCEKYQVHLFGVYFSTIWLTNLSDKVPFNATNTGSRVMQTTKNASLKQFFSFITSITLLVFCLIK